MIFLYSFVLLTLGLAKAVAAWRAGALERRYAKAALAAEKLLRAADAKAGNGRGPADPAAAAKRQYLLGVLVQKRDALEAKHAVWQGRADRLGAWVSLVRSWRGQKLPYTAGVLDVWMALVLVDHFGGDYVSAGKVVRAVTEWVQSSL
jgi:hypothetical protein